MSNTKTVEFTCACTKSFTVVEGMQCCSFCQRPLGGIPWRALKAVTPTSLAEGGEMAAVAAAAGAAGFILDYGTGGIITLVTAVVAADRVGRAGQKDKDLLPDVAAEAVFQGMKPVLWVAKTLFGKKTEEKANATK